MASLGVAAKCGVAQCEISWRWLRNRLGGSIGEEAKKAEMQSRHQCMQWPSASENCSASGSMPAKLLSCKLIGHNVKWLARLAKISWQ